MVNSNLLKVTLAKGVTFYLPEELAEKENSRFIDGYTRPPMEFKIATGIDVSQEYNFCNYPPQVIEYLCKSLIYGHDWSDRIASIIDRIFEELMEYNHCMERWYFRQTYEKRDILIGMTSMFNTDDIDIFLTRIPSIETSPKETKIIDYFDNIFGGVVTSYFLQWKLSEKTLDRIIEQMYKKRPLV